MAVKVDYHKAEKILRELAVEARSIELSSSWVEDVTRLSVACEGSSRTFIAVLGTALLARATNPAIDPFSLQAKSGPRGYSARGLATAVLAAHAPQLGIDIGTAGREPLNNQPFFAEPLITSTLPVHGRARAAYEILLELLGKIEGIKSEKDARDALQAFFQVREKKRRKMTVSAGAGEELYETDLLKIIGRFVAEDSEGGLRAQVVAAGLLDVAFGPDNVKTGRINDPSARLPGDVHVFRQAEIERSFEVRDKPVTAEDVRIFLEYSVKASVQTIAILAVSPTQLALDITGLKRLATARHVRLEVFDSWPDFLRQVLFWAQSEGPAVGAAYRSILKRALEHGVSPTGIKILEDAIAVVGQRPL